MRFVRCTVHIRTATLLPSDVRRPCAAACARADSVARESGRAYLRPNTLLFDFHYWPMSEYLGIRWRAPEGIMFVCDMRLCSSHFGCMSTIPRRVAPAGLRFAARHTCLQPPPPHPLGREIFHNLPSEVVCFSLGPKNKKAVPYSRP